MGLTSPFWDGNGKKTNKCVPAIWDGNGNYQKSFLRFGWGTGITKNLSRYLGREGVLVWKYMETGIPAHAWNKH